ncbi:NYN domain-containing protein [Qipengyuania aquimaris]|uniref:NYN domain-containing protein n=1 Tax=Qipengyuania aquimaris TaxID=255984 RepID=UPI001CD6FE1E|nr:NYN domain-containing protein [Qipengyuania aquimaris]MCA0903221.1 NYN domain-containing protein [Qipengyuania aquimaris]
MRTRVYVDGYNLYYACLKRSPHKWLNIHQLACSQLPKNSIDKTRYFTARVSARPHDPKQPQRQETYFRALATIPEIEVHFGHFLTHEVSMPEAAAWKSGQYKPVRVVKTEEKGSDVNLATYLLMDAADDLFDVAVIISNDSDLKEPIRLVKDKFGKRIVLLGSRKTRLSGALKPHADFIRQFGPKALEDAQFDSELTDKVGKFNKPSDW